nr:unnamed protein product [Callosobruchus analis]CAI5858851.1 unnamed protein product [Callosobruchus analis]
MSFRRQVYIEPNQHSTNLPESIEITHEDTSYRIFLSLDSQKCFKCSKQGHIASHCPLSTQPQAHIETPSQSTTQQEKTNTQQANNNEITETSSQEQAASEQLTIPQEPKTHLPPTNEITQPTTTQPSESAKRSREIILETRRQTEKRQPEYQSTDAQQISTHNKNEDNQTNKSSKRNFSEAISPTTPTHDQTSDAANSPLFAVPKATKTKKHKTDTQPSYISQEAMEDVKTFIDNHRPALILNSNQFKSLLENTHGTHDIMTIIKDYTDDIKGLIEMILLVYPT